MPINIEDILGKAVEPAFTRALEQAFQSKADDLFKKAFANGSPLSNRLAEKFEQLFQRLIDEGIQWEKKKPGFKR